MNVHELIYQLTALIQIYMKLSECVSAVTYSHLQGVLNMQRTHRVKM